MTNSFKASTNNAHLYLIRNRRIKAPATAVDTLVELDLYDDKTKKYK